MKFSFIVPVYKKSPETFRKCLKSLFDMSHKDMEVICVFDGPDSVLEPIADEFPITKKVVIEHGGACKARNEGAKHATGDFLSFWDADCYAEPEMSAMWEMTLKDNLDCDFCYSGYAWTDPRMKGFESEAFDPYLLEHYNYIASMFPLAKDRFPGWDESLTGLQDWDYWRRVVRAGSKGAFIPGYGFVTEPPTEGSISHASEETVKERIEAVRRKLGDPERNIVAHGLTYKRETAFVSRLLGGDYIWNPFWLVKPYKLSLMVGFHTGSLSLIKKFLDKTDPSSKCGVYWMGMDAESFYTAPYYQVKMVLKDFEGKIHFHLCNEKRTQDILADMGIKAEIVQFPYDAEKEGVSLPEKFKVLVYADESHAKAVASVIKALPDIDFTIVLPDTYYNLMDYTVTLQYLNNPRLDNNSRNAMIKGRYLITNVEEPHAIYIPVGDDPVAFKNALIDKLRELKNKNLPNMEARNYYLESADPEKFKAAVLAHLEKKAEVCA